jgi:hypothetical protein
MKNKINPADYFNEFWQVDPTLEFHAEYGFASINEFGMRFNSLVRFWSLNRRWLSPIIESPKNFEKFHDDGSAESLGIAEVATIDNEFFPDFLNGFAISSLLSLLENLFSEVADEVADISGEQPELDNRKMPYIRKYILWLQRDCGWDLNLDKDTNRRLDAITEVRNRYIHKLSRDLPEQIKQTFEEMVSSPTLSQDKIPDQFVEETIRTIIHLGNLIEKCLIDYSPEKRSQ